MGDFAQKASLSASTNNHTGAHGVQFFRYISQEMM
jgi:hypothetical protein